MRRREPPLDRRLQTAVWCLLHDKEFVKRNASLLQPEALPRGALRWIVASAMEEWEQHKSLLMPPNLAVRLEQDSTERWGTTEDLVIDLYAEAWGAWTWDDNNIGSLRATATEWFRQQNTSKVLDEATDALEEGDVAGAEKALRKSAKTIGQSTSEGITLEDALRGRYERPAVSTGFAWFNKHWRGGLHQGQVGIIVAPSNGGKSMFLPYTTAAALKTGKGVAYYTTELSEDTVLKRIVATIAHVPINSLHDPTNMASAYKYTRELLDLREGTGGDEDTKGGWLNVRYRDPGSMTTADIDNDLDEFEAQGHHINLVICDGDDLKPERGKELYDQYLDIYSRLSALAASRDIAIWTAAQGTRESFKKEVLEPHHIGDSMWKLRKADMCVAMNMKPDNLTDEGRPIATFSVLKDRFYDTRRDVVDYVTDFGNKNTRGIPSFTWRDRYEAEPKGVMDAFE